MAGGSGRASSMAVLYEARAGHLRPLPRGPRGPPGRLGRAPLPGRPGVGRLHRQLAPVEELTALPKALRQRLAEELHPSLTEVVERVSDGGDTVKWLWRLDGGATVETVLMRYPERDTVCVSSQAGCAMACGFCATGQAGFERHLTPARSSSRSSSPCRAHTGAPAGGHRSLNVVFMGMGEPFANYDPTWAAVERMHDDLGIGARHITLSTVGILPGIRRLAGERLPVNLAVSLHAATDELRDELVPINRRYPLADLSRPPAPPTSPPEGRRLSFEWALIDGVNDGAEQAEPSPTCAGACRCPPT